MASWLVVDFGIVGKFSSKKFCPKMQNLRLETPIMQTFGGKICSCLLEFCLKFVMCIGKLQFSASVTFLTHDAATACIKMGLIISYTVMENCSGKISRLRMHK